MKIIVVVRGTALGGVERHAADLLELLNAAGHQACFAGPMRGWLGQWVRERGIEHLDLPMRGYWDLVSLIQLARYARRIDADLLHGHAQRGARYASWAARLCRLPSVATAHSTESRNYFGAATRLIAVSEAVRRTLLSAGLCEAKIAVVHNGVRDLMPETEGAAALRASLGFAPDAYIGCIAARFVRQKGHDVALRVLADAPELRSVCLVFAGKDNTEWAAQIKREAERLGLCSRVRFLGFRADVPRLMRAVDFVFAPSRQEGFSLSLLEAASVGTPVVATRVGGNTEAIMHGHTGLLADAESVPALARAIQRLRDDPAQTRRMGEQARAHYLQGLSINCMVEKTLAVYREAAGIRPLQPGGSIVLHVRRRCLAIATRMDRVLKTHVARHSRRA